jgi:DNA-binding response OmpR family regulator
MQDHTLRVGEELVMGGHVSLTIPAVEAGKVVLGITAEPNDGRRRQFLPSGTSLAGAVLIVEHDFTQREGLAAVLRQQGFTVLTSIDGNDALNKLSNRPIPDLILVDMLMSSRFGDGRWFLQQRRGSCVLASVPVIIMTAIPYVDMKWAASLGASGLIRKPFAVESLLAEIRRCLGNTTQEGNICSSPANQGGAFR